MFVILKEKGRNIAENYGSFDRFWYEPWCGSTEDNGVIRAARGKNHFILYNLWKGTMGHKYEYLGFKQVNVRQMGEKVSCIIW